MALFHKKHPLLSVADGCLTALTDLSDETFREGMLGPGIAIQPTAAAEVTVYAPCASVVSHIPESRHALVLTDDKGAEILIHIGIDTVKLQGEGFKTLVSEGTQVGCGEPLIVFEEEKIRNMGYETVIPVVICNAESFREIKTGTAGPVLHTQTTILTIIL